jgi:hypothetical protein
MKNEKENENVVGAETLSEQELREIAGGGFTLPPIMLPPIIIGPGPIVMPPCTTD